MEPAGHGHNGFAVDIAEDQFTLVGHDGRDWESGNIGIRHDYFIGDFIGEVAQAGAQDDADFVVKLLYFSAYEFGGLIDFCTDIILLILWHWFDYFPIKILILVSMAVLLLV